ncbi:MAG: preprotein translocase subunit SecE [Anaerolineae bacterium]|nr:MAG: preprotein translocase subunit SecE [Anaerolineae bacterium]
MGSSPAWPAKKFTGDAVLERVRRRFSRQNKESALTEKKENAIVRYYRETVGELRKVSWPTREEAIHLTRIVLLVLVVMAIFLGFVDWIGGILLNLALGIA